MKNIEPRKNVLGLVEGVRAAGLPLVVIGDALPGYEAYAADCKRASAGFARWLPRVDHDDPLLEWRLHTRRLKFEPLPPGHPRNQPETIQPAAFTCQEPDSMRNHRDPDMAGQI